MVLIEKDVFGSNSNKRAVEYTASDVRKILQRSFPQRKLVLSQLTFFNHAGVARANGETYKRGRRCYLLQDILSVATVLALKEEGIPLKNINSVPALVQQNASRIFASGPGCRLIGFGEHVSLEIPGMAKNQLPIEKFLNEEAPMQLLWGYDVGSLAKQLREIAESLPIQISQAA